MNTFDVALKYAKKGLKMIPVAPKSKRPILPDWVNASSLEEDTLREWFDHTENNIGIVTGKASGIIVIDIDSSDEIDGRQSLAEMEAKMGSFLPETVTSRTQSGGLHLWFRYPNGVETIRGKVGILPKVDTRADGNQVVVYPSIGEKGSYEWINDPWSTPMATLPKAWKQFICGEFDLDGLARIRIPKRAFTLPEEIHKGERNQKLLSYACSLASKKGTDATLIGGAVREVNATRCKPPITDEKELQHIIDWAVSKIGTNSIEIPDGLPQWIRVSDKGGYIIDDGMFLAEYKENHDLVCINGQFYVVDGQVDGNSIKQDIQNMVSPYVLTSLSAKVNSLYEGLRNECYIPAPPLIEDVVHTATCSLQINDSGVYEIQTGFTLNRLNVEYRPKAKAPMWKTFLRSLLEEEDIVTLQEFVGYCLVPTTVAQKALFIIGRGGEGKSVVGDVLHSLFTNSMVQGELHNLQENRFMLAQLENRLVFYDDDLQTSALKDTGTFKKLVTASIPLLVERKGEPHYEMLPYARIIASGNKSIEACYDHSDGFYRRLIVLKCKGKDPNRKDDRLLARTISDSELSGILNWAIEGLQRLMANNWTFTISERALANITQAEEESNNIIQFMDDVSAVVYDTKLDATGGELYDAYERWCEGNAMKPLATRTFSSYLRENSDRWKITYDNHIVRGGAHRRGYKGIGVLDGVKVEKIGRFKVTTGGMA